MAGLITWLEILNLPEYWDQTSWEVWDNINLQGWKNLMLTWWNWTGKSTILKVLHDSIERAKDVLMHPSREWFKRPEIQKNNPFQHFSISAGYMLSAQWEDETLQLGHQKGDMERIKDDELFIKFSESIQATYMLGTSNIFNYNLKSTYHQAVEVLRKYKAEKRVWDNFWVVDTAEAEDFLEVALKYAQEYWIPIEVMYWNIIALCSWTHDFTMCPNVVYWWVKPHWDENVILRAEKVILNDSQPVWESLWERSKRIISELREVQNQTVALLDEPTNGVDRKWKIVLRDDIFSTPDMVQLIVASHDEALIDRADDSDKWITCDLDQRHTV